MPDPEQQGGEEEGEVKAREGGGVQRGQRRKRFTFEAHSAFHLVTSCLLAAFLRMDNELHIKYRVRTHKCHKAAPRSVQLLRKNNNVLNRLPVQNTKLD